ncbi:Hypothetical predicted protein [Lecanosticta acicola]|uniref:CYTH domain-containing protein n=1 Tax=Lecanosticta acicola TaxID=111012 RepID=A0AAI8Z741_9PEZI|nr:Hypothetical predicted protein [Lecanosticta acicola]
MLRTNTLTGICRCRLSPHTLGHVRRTHSSPKTALLEVERKFNVAASPRLTSQLEIASKTGPPSQTVPCISIGILNFIPQPDEFINDQYFDTADSQLVSRGIWLRRRSTSTSDKSAPVVEWEAKVRVGGDYVNSEFEEIVGKAEIQEFLQPLEFDQLQQIVDLDSARQTWLALEPRIGSVDFGAASQTEVKVVVDTSTTEILDSLPDSEPPFHHVVGELELTRTVQLLGQGEEDKAMKGEETRKMSDELQAFMKRHETLFPMSPAPVGKLTAYFAWRKQVEEQLKMSMTTTH